MKKLLAVMLLVGCAEWTPTVKAGLRRQGESKLRSCLFMTNYNDVFTKQCIRESAEWCKTNGLEATCGTDGIFVDPPIVRHR